MQVTLEKLSGLEHKLNVTIPAEHIENEVQTKLHKLTLTAKIPGFRSGKVPLAMIQKRYESSVRADVIEKSIRETYTEAVKQEKLEPVGFPKIDIISVKPKDPLSYNAIFEIYPKIELVDFSQIKVEKPVAELTEEDVDDTLEKLRKDSVQWQKITDQERKSQAGDRLTVDFAFKVIGSSDTEVKIEKGVKFVLGDKSMWEDFENQLYGTSINEKKKYALQFPPTHMDKELVGKNAEFEVEIREICEPILPPLDDQFAEKFGIKDGGLENLKSEVRKNLEQELQTVLKNLFKSAIIDKLLDNHAIEVPKILVENELDQMANRWQKRFATTTTSPQFSRENFTNQAQRNVSLNLLLTTILKESKIEIEHQELREKLEKLAAAYDEAGKMVDMLLADQNRLSQIKSMLLEEKIIDYLATKFNVVEQEISYQDAITKEGKR